MLISLPVAADDIVALGFEPLSKMRSDKSAGSGNTDAQLLLWPIRLKLEFC